MESHLVSLTLIELLRCLVDCGLLILIWLVQLVIYPSLTYITSEQMDRWHPVYTRKVTIVVMPLMLGNMMIYMISLYNTTNSISLWLNAILIIAVWLVTFLRAVPLHEQMHTTDDCTLIAHKLVACNKYRTALWTVVFIITMIDVLVL